MGIKRRVRSQTAGPYRLKYLRKCGFAKRADRQACERDAKLYSRNDAVQIAEQYFYHPRSRTPLRNQLPDA